MASDDPLLELLLPHIQPDQIPPTPLATAYLGRLTSLPLSTLKTTEHTALHSSTHSTTLALQSLASRSHRTIITSASHLSTLQTSLTSLASSLSTLTSTLPTLDTSITTFTSTYTRPSAHLTTRADHHTLHTNLERLLDILHLPSLLSSLIASTNYPSALDTLAHVRRLQTLYPTSPTIIEISSACADLQNQLITALLTTLRGPLKLPTAMKTVGFYRRATADAAATNPNTDRAVFLVCRMAYIHSLLSALEPLRKLAEEEDAGGKSGVNTDRYLKRWLEVYREQSFAVVGMYRSIFPSSPAPATTTPASHSPSPIPALKRPQHSRSSSGFSVSEPGVEPTPDPLAGFVVALVEMLRGVLERWLGNVKDEGMRGSLLTQVVYASGSLGRLGGEFAGVLMGDGEEEWVRVVERQRGLSGKLEGLRGAT